MYKLNLIVLSDMNKTDSKSNMYKEFSTYWIFDDYENYGLGCTDVCSECIKWEDTDF